MTEIEKRNEDVGELIEKGKKYLNEKTAKAEEALKNWFSNNDDVLSEFCEWVKETVEAYKERQERDYKVEKKWHDILKASGNKTDPLEFLVETPEDRIRKALSGNLVFWFFEIKYGGTSKMSPIREFIDEYGETVINNALKDIAFKIAMSEEVKEVK
ncbi:MAG: hypothetical protein QXR16_03435 [Candidatus Micrarchaeaceae archaeon]